jgi:TorA maturation chaperone TorD
MENIQDLDFEEADQAEEQARAQLYGLLAELFYAPPSKALLEQLSVSKASGQGLFDVAWNTLSEACATMPQATVHEEFESLFISVGKPEVVLYGSYYMAGFMMEKPLAELRTTLAKLGLQRVDAMPESEDHIAALCDVMRHLIQEDSESDRFARQKQFYSEFIQPWVMELCSELAAHPNASFYAALASVAKAFFEIEAQAFEMA